MLIVKADQRAAMWPALLRQRVVAHVKASYPEDYAVLGPDLVGRAADVGIARAASHGFLLGDEVEKYVDLMFLLGSRFDEDPILPWAAAILANPAIGSPHVRIHNLEVTAAGYLQRTTGEDGEHYKAALIRARRTPFEELIARRADDPVKDLQLLLYWLYPQQYLSLSKASLAGLTARAAAAAEAHRMDIREGRAILAALMSLVGSHFDTDLLQPWAAPVLAAPDAPAVKIRALHQAAMDRLDRYRLVNREGAAR